MTTRPPSRTPKKKPGAPVTSGGRAVRRAPKPARTKPRSRKTSPVPAFNETQTSEGIVVIIGESLLVREFASLCSSRGLKTFIWTNDLPDAGERTRGSGAVRPEGASYAFELTNLDIERKRENLRWLDRVLGPETPIMSSSVTVSATEQASWITNRARLVGIGAMPTLTAPRLVEVAPTIYSPAAAVEAVARSFGSLGKEIEIVQDRVGLVFPRLVCRMINEAAFALAEEVSTPQAVDAAIRLGLNHPRGPVEWTERLGLPQVAAVLAALERETGDPRYRTAPLLRQMALAGEWWKR